ncbi:hypothetical protein Tco_1531991 [Tanacetum coccineum]
MIKMFPRRSEGEELEYPFFEGDGSSFDEWGDYGVADDDYEEAPVFDDDQYEEESVPVYDTDIEDVIEEEEGFVRKRGLDGEEDNGLCEDVAAQSLDVEKFERTSKIHKGVACYGIWNTKLIVMD